MLLLAFPTSCELIKPIIIGAVDVTLAYNESLFVITDVADGDFDITGSNLEHNHPGTVRIVAFQTGNAGLNGLVTLASDLDDLSSLDMTVNTLSDATPQCSPIDSTVDGFTVTTLSQEQSPTSASSSAPIGSGHGGTGGSISYPALTPAPALVMASVAGTPVEEVAPTPEQLIESCTEQPSLPPPISSPATEIVIVAVAAIFGMAIMA